MITEREDNIRSHRTATKQENSKQTSFHFECPSGTGVAAGSRPPQDQERIGAIRHHVHRTVKKGAAF
jgi:hypothetical protein